MFEDKIIKSAIAHARKNGKSIAKEYTDLTLYKSEPYPVSVFMAGSPGAGKTETAQSIIEQIGTSVLHIDADELRKEFAEYNGTNSNLFQSATSLLVEKLHDRALKQKQSFVLDGTFHNYKIATKNIIRSLKKKREVFIVYVHQDPLQAWDFVCRRAIKDGRHVPKDDFCEKYYAARETVNNIKTDFGSKVQLDIVVKDIDGTDFSYCENKNSIDTHVPQQYSKEELVSKI